MSTLDAHGLHSMIPEVEYRAYNAINYSHLKHGESSARRMKASIDGLLKPPGKLAVNQGTALHTLVLQPELFAETIVVEPEGIDRRTNAGKAKAAEFEAAAIGKTVIDASQFRVATAMAESIKGHKVASELLSRPGASEIVLRWAKDGIECKAKIDRYADAVRGHPPTLIDIKSTSGVSPADFERSIYEYGYHIQAAWYRLGYAAIHDGVLPEYRIIAVDSAPDYETVVYELEPETEAIGFALIGELFEKYARGVRTGEWPGIADNETRPVGIPIWAKRRFEEDAR